jgi:hypothetical protein
MIKLTIAATQSCDPEVHRQGCADVKRGLRSGKYQYSYQLEVETLPEAAHEFWADFIEEGSQTPEQSESYTRFLPCTEAAKHEAAFRDAREAREAR